MTSAGNRLMRVEVKPVRVIGTDGETEMQGSVGPQAVMYLIAA